MWSLLASFADVAGINGNSLNVSGPKTMIKSLHASNRLSIAKLNLPLRFSLSKLTLPLYPDDFRSDSKCSALSAVSECL